MTELPKVSNSKKIDDFMPNINQMYEALSKMVVKFQNISKEAFLSGAYANWHIKGLIYHTEKLIAEYRAIVEELKKRLETVGEADAFIMFTPQINHFMFEFYAFVNLARITLDNLRYILYPLFINESRQLPKTITDLEKGFTNCPVYERIAVNSELQYLIDLRNCIVHYRTFATSDNSIISRDGLDFDFEKHTGNNWTRPMAKAVYRITEKNDVVLNIFLPDKIYDKSDGNKKLSNFSYNNRINILAESIRFLRYIVFNYMEAFMLNIESQEKRFEYRKKGDFQTKFKNIRF